MKKRAIGFVKGRAYPSTEVVGARAKKNGARPNYTPRELIDIAERFNKIPASAEGVKIHWEHGTRMSDEIGLVTKLKYKDQDKWLHMHGSIRHDIRDAFAAAIQDEGFGKGISLCYSDVGNNKNFIEFSVVGNPDFDGARIQRYHSARPNEIFIPIGISARFFDLYATHMAEQQQQSTAPLSDDFNPDLHVHTLFDGSLMVLDASHVNPARQYAISKGLDAASVFFEDPAQHSGYTPEQMIQGVTLARAEHKRSMARLAAEENARRAQQQQEEAKKSRETVLPFAMRAAAPLRDDERHDSIVNDLVARMASNPEMQALGVLYSSQLETTDQELAALRAENARLRQQPAHVPIQNRPSFPSAQQEQFSEIMAHGAGGPKRQLHGHVNDSAEHENRTMTAWEKMTRNFVLGGSSSSSSSSVVDDTPAVINAHSGTPSGGAKRSLATPTESLHKWDGFDLFPSSAPNASSPSMSGAISIFAHNAGVVSSSSSSSRRTAQPDIPETIAPFLANIPDIGTLTTNAPSDMITRSKLKGIITGDIPSTMPGTMRPKTWLTENMISRNPRVFTSMIMAHHAPTIGTNQSDKLMGISQGGYGGSSAVIARRVMADPTLRDKYVWDTARFERRAKEFSDDDALFSRR